MLVYVYSPTPTAMDTTMRPETIVSRMIRLDMIVPPVFYKYEHPMLRQCVHGVFELVRQARGDDDADDERCGEQAETDRHVAVLDFFF